MALHVCENINEDLFVIINKLFSTKYPIDIFDLTNWSKLILLLPCFQRFSLFSRLYLKSKLWVVKLLKLNQERRQIFINLRFDKYFLKPKTLKLFLLYCTGWLLSGQMKWMKENTAPLISGIVRKGVEIRREIGNTM